MNTKKRLAVRRLLSGTLALLGFASCSEEFGGEDIMYEYGTPYSKFIVKGTVTSDADKPLKGIQVIVRQSWNNSILPSDTVYTDEKGAFNTGELGMGGIGMQKVYFNDIDGDENGGCIQVGFTCIEGYDGKTIRESGTLVYREIRILSRRADKIVERREKNG